MPLSLHQIQTEFAGALLDPDAAVPENLTGPDGSRALRRFAIYRNNVAVSLIDALQASFPVSAKLVGEEFFWAMAREYIRTEIPQTPILSAYGSSFPAFIAAFPPAHEIAYLPDVAAVEAAWAESYHAADAISLNSLEAFDLQETDLLQARFDFHPSVRFVNSEHPVGTIWLGHQGDFVVPPAKWNPEEVMLVRADAEVEIHFQTIGESCFAQALHRGATVEEAATEALAKFSSFDPGAGLIQLFKAGALAKLRMSGENEGSIS